ncbi:hypothetical protein ACSAZK_02360 [Methanosarcina sp. Mfa9]|uniref:hypothetical protein n=1 Tax=Methanosarcina sp. Mfa9 TaxID=3439063 RepID=UPI003F825BE0
MNGKYTILVICSMIFFFVAIGCINESNEIELDEETVSNIEALSPNLISNFSDLSLISNQYNVNDFGSGRGNIIIKGTIENANSEPNEKPYTTVVSYPVMVVWVDFYDKNKNYLFSSSEAGFDARYDCTKSFEVEYSEEMEWIKKIAYYRITVIRTDPVRASSANRVWG